MIRKANKNDREKAASLMYDAILDIGHALTGEEDKENVLQVMSEYFCEEQNRLSYKNCLVEELDGEVVGIVLTYHGKDAKDLDEPIQKYLEKKTGHAVSIDKEADETDFYIDTVSVAPKYRNQHIGTNLLNEAIHLGKKHGYPTISLVVEEDNKLAERLYRRLGFKYKKDITINHHNYHYLVIHQ